MVLDPALVEKILRHIDEKEVVKLAQEMVRIPSPTFNGSHSETDLALFLDDYLKAVGMKVQMQDVSGTKQVIGRYGGSGGGPSLMFNGHLDHNPPATGWTKDPYAGVVEDGWLYGSGIVNMKGQDAAMIAAAVAVHKAGLELKGDFMVSCVMGELLGGLGTEHMLQSGIVPDMAVVTEPTEFGLTTKHVGVFQARLHTYGKIRHFAGTQKGVHALEKMIKIITALGPSMTPMERGGWLKFEARPDFPGFPQFNIGWINAGLGKEYLKRPTLMPDVCTASFDCRYPPGKMSAATVRTDLEAVIERLKAGDPDLRVEIEAPPPGFKSHPAFEVSHDERIVKTVAKWHEYITKTKPAIGTGTILGGATDASHLSAKGVKAVVYGPGGKYLNVPDERIRVEDMVMAAKILALVAGDICS